MRGRPRKTAGKPIKMLTYEEVCDRHKDTDVITVHYDGIFRRGHWYEDHMLRMFAECKLSHVAGNDYKVEEFPKKGD